MTDSFDINNLTGKARDIATKIDSKFVKDNKLSGVELSIFLADCKHNGIEVENEAWYKKCKDLIDKQFQNLKDYVIRKEVIPQDAIHNYKADVIPDDTQVKEVHLKELSKLEEKINRSKQDLCKKMYDKWSAKFPKSPLKQDFYEKLYDVIETLNVTIPESAWDKENYSSLKEQIMDEVIAIFAGKSQLNPKSKNSIYNGIFQLATPGLKEAKSWAQKNPNVSGMENISNDMTITKFRNSSGTLQLDYLVAYIGKCKEYSKIGADESITPGQLWAMIKYPFKGKNSKLIQQKTDSISNVFKNSKIEQGLK